MPGGDRTGPAGAGPMTGRGVGICAGYDAPGFVNAGYGRRFGGGRGRGHGHGFGMGGGRGWRHQFYATGLPGWARGYDYPYHNPEAARPESAKAGELSYLKEQARYFKKALDGIMDRLNRLQKDTGNAEESQDKKEQEG